MCAPPPLNYYYFNLLSLLFSSPPSICVCALGQVIVSRMRYMSAKMEQRVRLLGLSTALANAHDLADWLGIDPRPGRGMYNFRPSVRPVPMEVHIRGFPGPHYCPRMATMNKPTYSAILEHSPKHPVLVFVASRRQTRLTALDLISFCAAADEPKQFLRGVGEEEVEAVAATCKDPALKHTLVYGVGLHHAGLCDHDRNTVEELFVNGRIQVQVSWVPTGGLRGRRAGKRAGMCPRERIYAHRPR